jgi:hypothetical protein
MLAVMFATILLLTGGFVFTQGGKVLGPVLAGVGGIILLIKVFA